MKSNTKNILFSIGLICILSCEDDQKKVSEIISKFHETKLELISPSTSESGEPNLFVSSNNRAYLSWVEYEDDTTDVLVFSELVDNDWQEPKEIARGTDWFVNWADFPSLIAHGEKDEWMSAHWLQKSAGGTYDYDVRITQSMNGGQRWTPSIIPHRDSIPAEHGFVTLLPMGEGRTFAVWLDGRNTKASGGHDSMKGHGHHGAMTLRSALIDSSGNLSEEAELDQRICDCCQTAAVQSGSSIIVAYRDRSDDEIRDISIVKGKDGEWTAPKNVSNDQWHISGCPVNGPSLATHGDEIALAWFTMADDEAKVQVAFSHDQGESFFERVRIDDGNPQGRVDIVMISEELAVVSWLEDEEESSHLRIKLLNVDGKILASRTIADMDPTRSSGFPRMERQKDRLIFAWTNVDEGLTSIRSAFFQL